MKKSYIKRFAAAFCAGTVLCASVFAAVTDLPVTTVGGVKCYYYDVQPKESIYQVGQKLGLSRDLISEYNPSASDGLKPRMRLYFPVTAFSVEDGVPTSASAAVASGSSTHVVKKGETIYGIARKYGMTPDALIALNPKASNGLRTGDVLVVEAAAPEGSDGTQKTAGNGAAASANDYTYDSDGKLVYVIKPGETLFSIASRNGVTLEALIEANPRLDPLRYKSGERIYIPNSIAAQEAPASVPASREENAGHESAVETAPMAEDEAIAEESTETVPVEEAPETAPAEEPAFTYEEASVSAEEEADDEEAEPLNVAVMLPFMLGEESQSRTTQLYTEFFKGMLMAADTLRNSQGTPVKFHFYDTASSLDTVQAMLRRPEIADMDMVVAPDNGMQLEAIVDAVDPQALVLNIFAVKDETYKTRRNLIQTNIPHDAMYAQAIEGFMNKSDGMLPVFISRNGGQADKDSFVRALKERLDAEGREYRDVVFSSSLGDEDLYGIDPNMTPVVFVPNSGSKNEFAKFVRALLSMRERAASPGDVTIFGYPEWVTFRGESFDEICNLNATIYSRFLVDEQDPDARRLRERYRALYGVDMFDAVPTQGILGFDTGMFIINGLRHMEETGEFPHEFNGVQNSLRLGWSGTTDTDDASGEALSNGGLVNEALILIDYAPGGQVESVKL